MIDIDIKNVANNPGVYKFKNKNRRIIYVGKAKNLHKRIYSYYKLTKQSSKFTSNERKTLAMLSEAVYLDYTIVSTELEALLLEYTWIKEFEPKYNIIYRDDKSYPYIAIDLSQKSPRIFFTRRLGIKNVRYFGPYAQAYEVKNVIKIIQSIFKIRSCTNTVFDKSKRNKKPCLLHHIGMCSGPCVKSISEDDYQKSIFQTLNFLNGKVDETVRSLTAKMYDASNKDFYELAAKYRDQIETVKNVFEKNNVFFDESVNADIFNLEKNNIEAIVYVLSIRRGRIVNERAFILDNLLLFFEDERISSTEESKEKYSEKLILERGILKFYEQQDSIKLNKDTLPNLLVLPFEIDSKIADLLTELYGKKIEIRIPKKGKFKELIEKTRVNAKEKLRLENINSISSVSKRSIALNDLQEKLSLNCPPYRIEGYDISHTSGKNKVASMVVFENGIPKKSHYRIYNLVDFKDDTASIREIIRRRFIKYIELNEERNVDKKADESFKTIPNLIIIDGGKPQIKATIEEIEKLNIEKINICSMAKRIDEVFVENSDRPVIFARRDLSLYLLQQIRDESHRFAIKMHRKRRAKDMFD